MNDEELPDVCPACGAPRDADPLPCQGGYDDPLACPAFSGDPEFIKHLLPNT